MTEEEETFLNELFIKRLREPKKTDKSALLCEEICILYEKEIGIINTQEQEKKCSLGCISESAY